NIADQEDLERMRGADDEGAHNGIARAISTRERNRQRVADDQIRLVVNKETSAEIDWIDAFTFFALRRSFRWSVVGIGDHRSAQLVEHDAGIRHDPPSI